MNKTRNQVAAKDRWNVEALYPDLDTWQQAFEKISRESHRPHWPEIESYRGRLHEGPTVVKEALELILSLERMLSKLYTYAHLRHDEDIANDENKIAFTRISTIWYDFQQEISWFDPELLSLSEEMLKSYLSSSILKDYQFFLKKIGRMKPHTLSSQEEELIALASKALQVPYKAFNALNDADFKFGFAVDSQEKKHEITHGQYAVYIRSEDRSLRQSAFKTYHHKYEEYENTICELLASQVQKNLFYARAKKYNSCLEAALFPHQIPVSVYRSLIEAVNSRLSSLHRYMDLRKRLLQVEELHLYDINVPLVPHMNIQMDYEAAEAIVIHSVAPLGTDYQRQLQLGLQQQRWVDRFENPNKRSGAYSSGCYDSMPYILMNYKNLMRDAFTLAHEAGHSMHSLLSRKTQPYQYAEYPIFLAEVASTFNEELLAQELLKQLKTPQEQMFLINQKVEDIRSTLFRQTLFAEFELLLHTMAEEGTPLTPKVLKQEYLALNAKYYGPSVIVDQGIQIEWARIPHFYYNFYVYQYATGISAALALSERILNGGEKERDAYLTFLKGGGSQYPLDLLRVAGIDMNSPEPVQAAIGKFDQLVDTLETLSSDVLSAR